MLQRTTEWLNSNRYRRYPFTDDADMRGGALTVPDSAILDFQATSDTPGAPRLVGVATYAAHDGLCLTFAIGDTRFDVDVPPAAAYPYTTTGLSDGLCYSVTLGDGCDQLMADTAASFVFACDLQPALLTVQNRHRVDSVKAYGFGHEPLHGVVTVRPGINCDPVVVAGEVRLNAGRGLGAGRACGANQNGVISSGTALLRLNGQTADDGGNVVIEVDGADIAPDPVDPNRLVVKTTKMLDNMKCG